MGKETLTQVEEAENIPHRINPKRNTGRQILIKLITIKKKKKIVKATNNIQRNLHKDNS